MLPYLTANSTQSSCCGIGPVDGVVNGLGSAWRLRQSDSHRSSQGHGAVSGVSRLLFAPGGAASLLHHVMHSRNRVTWSRMIGTTHHPSRSALTLRKVWKRRSPSSNKAWQVRLSGLGCTCRPGSPQGFDPRQTALMTGNCCSLDACTYSQTVSPVTSYQMQQGVNPDSLAKA